jgi:hypothetical protein
MIITICSSIVFAPKILEVKAQLEKMGHKVLIPCTTEHGAANPDKKINEDLEFCFQNDVMMDHFKKIEASDAILVLNYPKNNIKGYIGGSVLMETGLAYFLHKKIYLLYDFPDEKELRYSLEVKLTKPIIINGDLNKINKY